MRCDEDLRARVREPGGGVAGETSALRVEVRLGLVPEQVTIAGERAIDEQVGDHGKLAVSFGDHRDLHIVPRIVEIEAPILHEDFSTELLLDGVAERRRSARPERV